MQSLEAACEEGERPIKKAKLNQTSLLLSRHQENNLLENAFNKQFCIHSRLQELYNVESAKNPEQISEGLKYNSYLLEKLVEQERLNTLVVNLYPGNKGYSLAFPSSPHSEMGCDFEEPTMLETLKWPYEENELLRYIDNEELPAFFIDVLEPDFNFLFYSGCIIAEVRDYRRAYPHFKKCDIHHVLLKPTLQSILADINLIMEQHVDWGTEEKLHLESQILLAANPSLCVESNPAVASIQTKVNHCRQLLNTHRLRRTARKFSQDTVNRKRKLDQFTHRPGLELFNYITRLRAKSKNALATPKHVKKTPEDTFKPIPVPSLSAPNIAPPSQGVHINEFKAYQRPKETSDCSPQLIEEYVLETDMPSKEKGKSRVYHIKLSILQRPSNSEYLGELYLDRDHKKDERNGVACRFSLGSRAHANRYIQQFTEIFTEGGRKSVRIKYGLSPGLKERVALVQAQAAQLQAAQQAAQVNLAQQHLAQLNQNLQNTCPMPLVNGTVTSGITLLQQSPSVHNASSVSLLHPQMQPSQSKQQLTSQEAEINALATKLMNSAQQYQEASANAKQQKLAMSGSSSSSSNAAIINLLNSSPASNVNSDASAAVVNAINSGPILPQQVQTINQKLIGRKMTLSSLPNARVLNHTNLIAVNNSRMSLSDLNTSVPSSSAINFGQTVPIKQVISQRSPSSTSSSSSSGNSSDKSALSALLVGTPAADRPDIVNPNSNSLLLEKLASASKVNMNLNPSPSASNILSPKATAYSDLSKVSTVTLSNDEKVTRSKFFKDYAGEIYVDMDKMSDKTKPSFIKSSPKSNPVISPLSSPPPSSPVAAAASSSQTQNLNTINVQSLNLASLQNLSGLQNVQVQLSGFSQPISLSLNVSSTAGIQGHPASIIVSLPVATTGGYAGTSSIAPQQVTAGTSVGTPTVVLTNAGTAQLVTSSIKPINQTNIRNATQTGVTLAQGTPQFQILTSVQRPKLQQTSGIQQNAATRNIQRTPFTIKMTTPNTTQVTMTSSPNSLSSQQLQLALQKQAQIQQFQQIYNQQQRSSPTNGAGKVRRRSNTSSDTQQ